MKYPPSSFLVLLLASCGGLSPSPTSPQTVTCAHEFAGLDRSEWADRLRDLGRDEIVSELLPKGDVQVMIVAGAVDVLLDGVWTTLATGATTVACP